MTKEMKTQWHPAFCSAVKLELIENKDDLNLDTYVKVIGYACMYKASEVHVGDIDLDDITITLVREGKPRELLKWFMKNDYEVREVYNGIYYVEKERSFPIQVIVSGKLSRENQKWLTLLSSNLKRKDADRKRRTNPWEFKEESHSRRNRGIFRYSAGGG